MTHELLIPFYKGQSASNNFVYSWGPLAKLCTRITKALFEHNGSLQYKHYIYIQIYASGNEKLHKSIVSGF